MQFDLGLKSPDARIRRPVTATDDLDAFRSLDAHVGAAVLAGESQIGAALADAQPVLCHNVSVTRAFLLHGSKGR